MLLLIVVLFRLWFVAPVTFVSPFLLSVPPVTPLVSLN